MPGHCFSKDLENDQEYILFLNALEGRDDLFEQSQGADLATNLMEYMGVCDLNMQYPAGRWNDVYHFVLQTITLPVSKWEQNLKMGVFVVSLGIHLGPIPQNHSQDQSQI